MNGVYNMVFLVFIFGLLIALPYIYSIADMLMNSFYDQINLIQPNYISTASMEMYVKTRDIFYAGITGVLIPCMLIVMYASTFIDRNQDTVGYFVTALTIVVGTPLMIYIYSIVLTQMLNVSFLNPAYIASIYFTNMVPIFVLNMLFTLASFVFLAKGRITNVGVQL